VKLFNVTKVKAGMLDPRFTPVARICLIVALAIAMAAGLSYPAHADDVGIVSGRVFDEGTGEPLAGATVMVLGTNLGAFSDLDGQYRIKNVPAGVHSIQATMVGYNKIEVTELTVSAGDVANIDLTLSPADVKVQDIKVTARRQRNNQAALLAERQKATAVSDAISSEEISRSGSGDVAEAMTKVTGASVVDGKFVYVRGMGERYSNAQLNGSALPSPDPDKKAVPMDLIPADLLDNIVVSKTFTPDKPGNFAGGSVNIGTKSFPDKRTLVFSTSTGYNSEVNLEDGALTHNGSSTDWLGYDDGYRDLPDFLRDTPVGFVGPSLTFNVPVAEGPVRDSMLRVVDLAGRTPEALNKELAPVTHRPPINQSHSIRYGDLFQVFDRPLGVQASLTYGRKYSSYNEGYYGKYWLGGEGEDTLRVDAELVDQKSAEEVSWGLLASTNYRLHPNHKLGVAYIRNQQGTTTSRYLDGPIPEHTPEGEPYELRAFALNYKEVWLQTLQFSGEHLFGKTRFDWKASTSKTGRDEPDTRYFQDQMQFILEDSTGQVMDTTFSILRQAFPVPRRYWRELDETSDELSFNIEAPISKAAKLKLGGFTQSAEREYSEYKFQYQAVLGQYIKFEGDINAYAQDFGLDTILYLTNRNGDTVLEQYVFANTITNVSEDRSQYNGDQSIAAWYGMLELPLYGMPNAPVLGSLFDHTTIIGGARFETTDMFARTEDDGYAPGIIREDDWLPSVNVVVSLTDNMNFRAAYTKTLARPTLREISPHPSEDFGVGYFRIGNSELDRTLISNYDLRWEWFVRPGEVIALSAFYKDIENPIEWSFIGSNNSIIPRNTGYAKVRGLEFEFRRRLDHSGLGFLKHIQVGGNVSLVLSEVAVDTAEVQIIRAEYDPGFDGTRPLQGQSPYLINVDVGYQNYEAGTSVSLFYNIFGERLAFNSEQGTPDVYEQPRHQLDLLASQRLFGRGGPRIKFSVKNLLDEDSKFTYDQDAVDKLTGGSGREYVFSRYEIGRTISLGLSYQIW
jgi:outer membrane receptor for ferrienterochelin and colicin